jgi:hypothetical protein
LDVQLVVALIAGAVALLSAAGTVWSSIRNAERAAANARAVEQLKIDSARAIEQLKIDYDRLKSAAQRQREISNFSEPLARAAYDLQSRIYNILRQDLIGVHLVRGNGREREYVTENTAFLVAQYLCWAELVRREIQFIDLGESRRTRDLLRLQDDIYAKWGTDRHAPLFRIFAGEQRAIGEALINVGPRGPECLGYGAFLKAFGQGANPLIDAVRADVASLASDLNRAVPRLTELQHALIDLLEMLDPEYIRFPRDRRSKV